MSCAIISNNSGPYVCRLNWQGLNPVGFILSDFRQGKRIDVTGSNGFLGSFRVDVPQAAPRNEVCVPRVSEYNLRDLDAIPDATKIRIAK